MKVLRIISLAIFTIFCLEGIVRLSGIYQTEFNFVCPCNSLGLRDTKEFVNTGEDQYKLLFLGDSFTEGVGASCGKTIPEVFQQLAGDSVVVYNGGVVGADPFFYLNWYPDYFSALQADEIIIILNNSDISDYIIRGGEERFIEDQQKAIFRPAPVFANIYEHSHFFRFFIHFILRYDFTLLNSRSFAKASDEAILAIAQRINLWAAENTYRGCSTLSFLGK